MPSASFFFIFVFPTQFILQLIGSAQIKLLMTEYKTRIFVASEVTTLSYEQQALARPIIFFTISVDLMFRHFSAFSWNGTCSPSSWRLWTRSVAATSAFSSFRPSTSCSKTSGTRRPYVSCSYNVDYKECDQIGVFWKLLVTNFRTIVA